MEQQLDINDLVVSAGNLESSLKGVEALLFHRFDDTNVTREDVNALIGLVASIKCLAEKHADELSKYSVGR